MCLLYNIHRGKGKKAAKVKDFMPSDFRSHRPQKRMTTEQMIHVAKQITALNK